MPDSTFLHIQGSGAVPTRVLELPIGPIRVGRGPLCEVRVIEAGLGDVQCLLRRRGNTWHYQPVGPPGLVFIEGRAADQARPLPLGVPLRVGDHWLTLRSAGTTAEAFGSFETPIPVDPASVETTPSPDEPPRAAPPDDADDRLKRWQARVDQRDQWLKDRQDEKRWEARWKAAGESIRARSPSPTPPPAARPAPTPPPAARPDPTLPSNPGRTIDPRTTPTFRRIAEPSPRPTPIRVPHRTPPAPEPEVAEPGTVVEPPPEPSRALVALPAPTIDWAGARNDPEPEPDSEPEPEPAASSLVIVAEPEVAEPPEPVLEARGGPPLPIDPIEPATVEAEPEPEAEPPVAAIEPEIWIEPLPRAEEPALLAEELEPIVAPPGLPVSEWPSARSIFAAQGVRPTGSAPSPTRKRQSAPTPTDPMAPSSWSIPGWLGVIPATMLTLLVGTLGLGLAVTWTTEAANRDEAIVRATRGAGVIARAIDPTLIPQGNWWRSTAPDLAAWSMALARSTDGEDHSETIRSLTEAARHASPLAATTRFATEPRAETDGELAHLGRSRDVVTLAWAGKRLHESGKTEAALKAFRSALAMAAQSRHAVLEPPAFDEDSQIRRYRLPREAILGVVIQAMVKAGDWSAENWTDVLPGSATAPLVASRILRKAGKPVEADRLADLAIARSESSVAPGLDQAEHAAAVAEAMAARGRWADAAEQYRVAIDRTDDDPTRRRYWLNLAELAQRTGDDATRARAIESAKAFDANDEISERARRQQQNNPGLASSLPRP